MQVLDLIPRIAQPGCGGAHSNPRVQGMEAERSEIQGHLRFEARLRYTSPYLKKITQ